MYNLNKINIISYWNNLCNNLKKNVPEIFENFNQTNPLIMNQDQIDYISITINNIRFVYLF